MPSQNGQRRLFQELLHDSTVNIHPNGECPLQGPRNKVQSSDRIWCCPQKSSYATMGTKLNQILCKQSLLTKRIPMSKIRILNGSASKSVRCSNSEEECIMPKGLRKDSDSDQKKISLKCPRTNLFHIMHTLRRRSMHSPMAP